jgi:hypothetical protein
MYLELLGIIMENRLPVKLGDRVKEKRGNPVPLANS